MALTGDLSELDLKGILNLVQSMKGTGKLAIIGDSTNVFLYFKDGVIVNAEGDKDPISSFEKAAGLRSGKFEFIKTDDVKEGEKAKELQVLAKDIDNILKRWEELKKRFPNYDIVFDIGESQSEEVKLTPEEWKILALVREPTTLLRLLMNSPMGEMKTLEILSSLFDKGLITMSFEKEDILKEEDLVIPVKETGWYAVNTPIYGERNITFYNKIDGRKDFQTICKEMGITLREGRQILRYLVSNGKISLRKKTK
ncbi:DUF4388 domain-containing protein [Caldisericum sp.]|jgi:hypothetical protein|uniref:DUF4388 domain-containing protein n=1 Tax=Caldisericum sp. TaxID=2499687 RepID=UPI003D123D48